MRWSATARNGASYVKARAALIAASATVVLAALLMLASASAASPVLEYVVPGDHFPVGFTADGGGVTAALSGFDTVVHCTGSHGGGEITGLRSTVSSYVFTGCETQGGADGGHKCKSVSANAGEITAAAIVAELVYTDQAKHEVGMLLEPHGGVYMNFECGGESVTAIGPFLSPVGPINQEATSFTATLSRSGAMQTPDEYENANGEKLPAIPMGERGTHPSVTTGVELSFTISPSVPIAIKAITATEVEAKQHEVEVRQAEQRQHEEEAAAAAAAKRQQEEAAAKRHHEEEVAAANRRQEEEGAAQQKREEDALTSLKVAISRALTATGKAAKIGTLLKHGGLTLAFGSSEPGTLVIQWWQVPRGAHVARNGQPKAALVAQGTALFAGAGVGRVKIGLTRAGRRLLAHASKLKLTIRIRFTPVAHPTISATSVVQIK